jgi:peptide/nickel transport system substrate-binding protein
MSLVIAVILVIATALPGCAKSPAEDASAQKVTEEQPAKEKVLVIGYDRDAETLDHIKTAWYSDALIYIFDRLVSRDYNFNYKPGLAERWETSADGLTWTFFLKKGVKFHDGKPFTAADVKWTIDKIKDPDTASPFAGDLAAIKEVVVKDEHTVDVILNNPFPNLLFNLSNTASGIASKEAYEKYGDEYGSKYVIGTGPYMLQEWIKGDKLVITKNPEYNWGPEWMTNKGPALIDKIVLKVIPEETSRLMELEAGNVHILRNVPATFIEKLENSQDVEILRGEATKLGYLAYACDKKPFTDVRVRQAINHAINREDIIKYVFREVGIPAYGYLPPALKDEYYADSEKDGYKYDVDKAIQLLKEAGYEKGLKLSLSSENTTESLSLIHI